MAKTSRKLSLRKETLRKLDAGQLAQVNGGATIDYVILSVPSKTSGPTHTDPSTFGVQAYNLNYNFNYYFYW